MNKVLCLLICLVVTAAAAQSLPVAELQSLPVSELRDSPTYPLAEFAAQAALQKAMKQSVVVEYGGAIVRCAEGFRFTEPVTQNDTYNVNYRIRPGHCRVVGVYHTHPAGLKSYKFSRTDAETAARLNVTVYLGVVQDDSLRVLRPGLPPEFGVRIGYVHGPIYLFDALDEVSYAAVSP